MSVSRLPGHGDTLVLPRRDRRRTERPASHLPGSSLHQRVLALQRVIGNSATQAALERGGRRTLQRLVLTTERPAAPTDSPKEIAAKREVELAVAALARGGHAVSFIEDAEPSLDAKNYIVGHSSGSTIGDYNAKTLAEFLVNRGMTSGMVVRLVGCYTGTDRETEAKIEESLARSLAVQLRDVHKLDNIAVKGSLGELVKTKRKIEKARPGTTGVYTGVPHNYQNQLAKQQKSLMRTLGAALAKLLETSSPEQFAKIRTHIRVTFESTLGNVPDAVSDDAADWVKARGEVAKQLQQQLRKSFNQTDLSKTEKGFDAVIGAMSAMADTINGDFKDAFDASTRIYFEACTKIVDTWLGGVANLPTKRRPGNITFKVGKPPLFEKSNTYQEDLKEGELVQ
jgi:hypothetical protein